MNGSPAVVYGIGKTRITTYAVDGTPLFRYTLDAEAPEGLALAFQPEGITHQLGSGAGWRRVFAPRGFRPSLSIKWDVALQTQREQWNEGWDVPIAIETASALGQIVSAASAAPCLVEPHLDKSYSFQAQPDPGKAFVLSDYKRAAHRGLKLDLIASTLTATIPTWS